MIRVNLLKPLQAQRPMTLVDEPKGVGKRLAFALLGLAVIGGLYFFLQKHGGKEKEVQPQPVVVAPPPKPEPPSLEPKRPAPVSVDAVEEIVREATAEFAEPPPPAGYADFTPSQRIAYQLLAGTRILRDLQAATPPEIGFAQVVFTAPGEFYVRGLAATEEDLQRFQAALTALPGATIRKNQSRPVGAAKTAREFSFLGKVDYPVAEAARPENRVVTRDQLAAALKGFSGTAKEAGVSLQDPKLQKSTSVGGFERMLYKAEARGDYAHLQAFLEKIRDAQSSVGVLRLALEARGDEKMIASLDLLVYAQ